MDELERVRMALERVRCPAVCSESGLHGLITQALASQGLDVHHEVHLAPRCRIDFLVGGVGVEVKKSRPERGALLRQLARYAACTQVKCLLVVAPRGVNLPREVGGKPVRMLALERLWGISLP